MIKVASKDVRYYLSIFRTLSTLYMHYYTVLKDFSFQWKSLDDRKDEEAPDAPDISKTLKVIQWLEACVAFVHRLIEVHV